MILQLGNAFCRSVSHPSGEDRTRTSAQNGAKEGPVSAGGAKSGVFPGVDLKLMAVIQAWAELLESVKRAACGDGQGGVEASIFCSTVGQAIPVSLAEILPR